MSSIEISFVIASNRPSFLAEFYASFNKVEKLPGMNSDHYVVKLKNGLKIEFYKPSENQTIEGRGRFSSICFQKSPSTDPLPILEEWISNMKRLGASITSKPRSSFFGAEVWVADPDGNNFLILVPSVLNQVIT